MRVRAGKSVPESVFSRPRARPRRPELPGISSEPIGGYRGVIGRKTGFAGAAGRILLFEAVRGGRNRQAPGFSFQISKCRACCCLRGRKVYPSGKCCH